MPFDMLKCLLEIAIKLLEELEVFTDDFGTGREFNISAMIWVTTAIGLVSHAYHT